MSKILYGISKAYYAVATVSGSTVTYATPVALPGAVNLSIDAEGELTPFYADNITYWEGASNNGYSCELELAMIPESFYTDCLGFTKDTNGVLIEDATVQPKEFAFLFQVETDGDAKRVLYYNCKATRPSSEHGTVEDTVEPGTETISLNARPRTTDAKVKASCDDSTATGYSTWFTTVYETP